MNQESGLPFYLALRQDFLFLLGIPCTPGLLDAAVCTTCRTVVVLGLQMFASALGFVCVFQGFRLRSSGLQSKGSHPLSPVPHLHLRAHTRQCHFTKKAVEATRADQEVSELTARSPGERQLPRALVTLGLGLKAMLEAEVQ